MHTDIIHQRVCSYLLSLFLQVHFSENTPDIVFSRSPDSRILTSSAPSQADELAALQLQFINRNISAVFQTDSAQWTSAKVFPAYSGRTVQASHLIPYSPSPVKSLISPVQALKRFPYSVVFFNLSPIVISVNLVNVKSW